MLYFLFFISFILSNQLHEIVYKGFLYNEALNINAPTNYDEHKEYMKIISNKSDALLNYIDNELIKTTKIIKVIDSFNGKNTILTNQCIKSLTLIKKFVGKCIPLKLQPYIKDSFLEQIFQELKLLCSDIGTLVDRLDCSSKFSYGYEFPMKFETTEIKEYFRNIEPNLRVVLLYSFITESRNAKTHRRIHNQNEEDILYDENYMVISEVINKDDARKNMDIEMGLLNDELRSYYQNKTIGITCGLCRKVIQPDYYVFSFLCGHQVHILCMKNDIRENDTKYCHICGDDFWTEV
ncbi:hypothetical protein SLOPH_697 [Spraguea lophii 42_110]|uniref:RING-type domain-containing protein n=1 Tax=Spraguea lophii (strain 42_110) TaxID=1358809 RepID=S7W4V3_SPRLO|nr:hypothetical protein SLOPH_697 [Spraguea lophii 42_110]